MTAAMMLALWALPAQAGPLRTGQGTPWTIGDGHAQVGLLSQARWGVDDATELSTTGLSSIVAPRVEVKRTVVDEDWGFAVRGGLGVPTPGLGLLRGTVLTSDPKQRAGFGTILRAGAIGGYKTDSFRLGLDVGVRVGVADGFTLESPGHPFLDLWLAPLAEGPIGRAGLRGEWVYRDGKKPRLLLEGETAVHVGGYGPDYTGQGWVTVALGKRAGLGAGLVVANEKLAPRLHEFEGRKWALAPLGDFKLRW